MNDANVTYTLKEMLDKAERAADARHRETQLNISEVGHQVAQLTDRVVELEADRIRRKNTEYVVGKAWVAVIAVLGIIVNLPALLYYINVGRP